MNFKPAQTFKPDDGTILKIYCVILNFKKKTKEKKFLKKFCKKNKFFFFFIITLKLGKIWKKIENIINNNYSWWEFHHYDSNRPRSKSQRYFHDQLPTKNESYLKNLKKINFLFLSFTPVNTQFMQFMIELWIIL